MTNDQIDRQRWCASDLKRGFGVVDTLGMRLRVLLRLRLACAGHRAGKLGQTARCGYLLGVYYGECTHCGAWHVHWRHMAPWVRRLARLLGGAPS